MHVAPDHETGDGQHDGGGSSEQRDAARAATHRPQHVGVVGRGVTARGGERRLLREPLVMHHERGAIDAAERDRRSLQQFLAIESRATIDPDGMIAIDAQLVAPGVAYEVTMLGRHHGTGGRREHHVATGIRAHRHAQRSDAGRRIDRPASGPRTCSVRVRS
ncbi:MAG: hypothetical protein U1F11_01380 [Steroidobacteraceae bacterium]